MAIHIDVESDTLYLRGEEKGLEKGLEKSVIKLWQKGIEPSMICNLLDLPIEQIERIIADFKSKKDK